MIKVKNNKKLPFHMGKFLDPYFSEDEEVVDLLMETIIPSFDLRWLILTNKRIIQASYIWFEYKFRDVSFEGMDMQYSEGVFFDSLRVKSITDDYTGNFYRFNRQRTVEFMNEIDVLTRNFNTQKKKHEKEMDHLLMEELILEGQLSPEDDPGHKKKLEELRKKLANLDNMS